MGPLRYLTSENRLLLNRAAHRRGSAFHFELTECVRSLSPTNDLRYLTYRSKLARIAREMHEKTIGECGPDTKLLIERFEKGARCIVLAHQPNLFCGLDILQLFVVQYVLFEQLQTHMGEGVVPVYLLVNYDTCEDGRFRRSCLPHPLKLQNECLHYHEARERKTTITAMAPPPSDTTIAAWREQLNKYRGEVEPQNISAAIDALTVRGAGRATSIADYNAAYLFRLLKRLLGYAPVFIDGFQYFSALQTELREAASLLVGKGIRKHSDLLWAITTEGIREALPNEEIGCEDGNVVVPRVILDNLLDRKLLGSIINVSYAGQLNHLLASVELGSDHLSLPSHLLFEPRFDQKHFVRRPFPSKMITELERGKASTLYYLLSLGGDRLSHAISAWMRELREQSLSLMEPIQLFTENQHEKTLDSCN